MKRASATYSFTSGVVLDKASAFAINEFEKETVCAKR